MFQAFRDALIRGLTVGLVLYIGAHFLGVFTFLGAKPYTVMVPVADANGLFPRSEIDYRGVKAGEISGPINTGVNGAVLAVTEVQAPSEADFLAKRDQIRDSLLQSKEQELFGLFVTNLRDQMEKSGKIKINQDELKALTKAGSEPGM